MFCNKFPYSSKDSAETWWGGRLRLKQAKLSAVTVASSRNAQNHRPEKNRDREPSNKNINVQEMQPIDNGQVTEAIEATETLSMNSELSGGGMPAVSRFGLQESITHH